MKKDNIEDIYRDLKTFSKEPPKELWDKVETRLHSKNRFRGTLFLWSFIVLVLVVFLGYVIINRSDDFNHQPTNEITDSEQPINNNKTNDNGINSNKINTSEQQTTKIIDESLNDNNEGAPSNKSNAKDDELLNNSVKQKQLSDKKNTITNEEQGETYRIEETPEQKVQQSKKQKNVQKGNHINQLIDEKSTITNKEKSRYNNSYALSNKKKGFEKGINDKEVNNNKSIDNGTTLLNNENSNSRDVTNKDVVNRDVAGKNSISKDVVNNKNFSNKSAINKDTYIPQNINTNTVNSEKENAIANNDSISKTDKKPIAEKSEEIIAKKDEENDSTDVVDVTYKKWSIEVLGGIANTTSESSFEDVSFNTTPQNDFVYALKIGYNISDRLTIKSGIGRNILGQQIDSVSYVNSSENITTNLGILQFTDEGRNLTDRQEILFFSSQESVIVFDEEFQNGLEVFFNKGTLRQQLNYIQVPLEVSYDFLSKSKYNISLGIGGNVNFLTENNAYLNDQQIGENLDVNKTIFGATINSSFTYKLTKTINLFIEPSYNYFQKPIDNKNQNFKNTQFRAVFGLRYSF